MDGQGGLLAHKESIASSRAFKESGGRLVALSFPETRVQRLTEVFVKREGRWVHPGWHLDAR